MPRRMTPDKWSAITTQDATQARPMRESSEVVLAEVREMCPVTIADIVAGTGLAITTVRRALARLERDGLVEHSSYQRRARVYMAVDT
jgi:DNA-binding GntR family transcriptional regulator